MINKMLDVLYVEDDASDAEFVQAALRESGNDSRVSLKVVEDGEQALEYLKNSEGSVGQSPDLVLLDLNLPRVSGKQVLRAIKASPKMKKTPVVIFSTSAVQADIDESFENGAAGYITKPSGFERYKDVVHMLTEYWSKASSLPTK